MTQAIDRFDCWYCGFSGDYSEWFVLPEARHMECPDCQTYQKIVEAAKLAERNAYIEDRSRSTW